MKIIVGVLAVFVIASGGFAGFVWLKINRAGGLIPFIEAQINQQNSGISGQVEDAELSLHLSAAMLRLTATNVRIKTHDIDFTVPKSEIGFSVLSIIKGQAEYIRLDGLNIGITRSDRGWQYNMPTGLITAGVGGTRGFDALKEIHISNAQFTLQHKYSGKQNPKKQTITITPITAIVTQKDGNITAAITITEAFGGDAKMNITHNLKTGEASINADLNEINAADIYPHLGVNIPEVSELGTVSGRVNMVAKGGQIAMIDSNLTSSGGRVNLPLLGEIEFHAAALGFTYDSAKDELTINDFAMRIDEANISRDSLINFTGNVQGLLGNAPIITAKLFGRDMGIETITRLWPDDGKNKLRSKFDEMFDGGRVQSIAIDLTARIDHAQRIFTVDTVDMIAELRAIRLNAKVASIENLVGTLGARLEVSIGEGDKVERATAHILLQDARLLVKGMEKITPINGIELRAHLDGSKIIVERLAVDAGVQGQMAVAASFDLEADWRPHRVDIGIRAEQINKDFLNHLWPEAIQPRVRQWFHTNVRGGIISGFEMKGGVDLPRGAKPKLLFLEGQTELSDANIGSLIGLPKLEQTKAKIKFDQNFMQADFTQGFLGGLDMQGSRLIIRNNEAGTMADLSLFGKGDFGDAAAILNSKQLNVFAASGLNVSDASGDIDAALALKWIIPQKGQDIKDTGGFDIDFSASIFGASIKQIIPSIDLHDAAMDVSVNGGVATITGRGMLNNAPALIAVSNKQGGKMEMSIILNKSEALAAEAMARTGIEFGGKIGGTLTATKTRPSAPLVLDVAINLDDASFNINALGLAKIPGEAGKITALATFEAGKITGIDGIVFEGDVLNARGAMQFNTDGSFHGGVFNNIAWPGNDITSLIINPGKDTIGFAVAADAHIVDLTPLRRVKGKADNSLPPLSIALRANRLIVDDKVSLAGEVSIAVDEGGSGQANFKGDLVLAGKPFMAAVNLNAKFGRGDDDILTGKGLIGTAEVSVTFTPTDAGGAIFELRTADAGEVLTRLQIIDALRGGTMVMRAEFDAENKDNFTTHFELENFRVVDAPAVVQTLSVLSLTSFFGLVDDDGAYFDSGKATIEIKDGKQIIHSAEAAGAAIGIEFVGAVLRDENRLDVSGVLRPFHIATDIINHIPIIGKIIGGTDGTGLFAIQFTMKGDIKNPQTNVKRTSIIPGIIRDALNPEWIKNERQRIIGDG